MNAATHNVSVLWSNDLAVGSDALDTHNHDMFAQFAECEAMIASCTSVELVAWFHSVLNQLDALLLAEQEVLASIDYPELAFHCKIHTQATTRCMIARDQLAKTADETHIQQITRETCAALTVWLMRHVQDADKLFFPYIDARFRSG
jgi:hemerythrin-like metal-binding protein